MKRSIAISLCVSFLIFFAIPVYGQSNAGNVVINELDTNPPGDDWKFASEWVELYNPTESTVDVGDWKISSLTLKKTLSIPTGTVIEPEQFLRFTHTSGWFADANDVIELRDGNDVVIDVTPLLSDLKNDLTSWQRIYDGYDFDSINDWNFVTATVGASNGKLPETETHNEITVSVASDKSQYVFGETVTLQGNVSEEVFTTFPYFSYEPIVLTISGPNYNKTESLYPDLNKEFKTMFSLHKVLGVNEGSYAVSVSYSGATDQATFTVSPSVKTPDESKQTGTLSLLTDKSEYIPGETVRVTGNTDNVIPFEGLKFQISDPLGSIVASGDLFPTGGEFSTDVFMTTVDPAYGTYEITGMYFDQSLTISFELVPDSKENMIISLHTDKEVYGLGETVTVTGRLNSLWVDSLDLEILQTKNIARTGSTGGGSVMKILDVVRLEGDGRFEYSFSIPDGESRLGDYVIRVSQDVGSATKSIVVSENPDEYVLFDRPIAVVTDKSTYSLGDIMVIGGKIANPVSRSSFEIPPVKFTFSSTDRTGALVDLELTAIPDSSGRFSIETLIPQTIFSTGDYVVEATYEGLTESVTIELVDSLVSENASVAIDKEVYGLGETVNLDGTLPPRGENTVIISIIKPDGTIINSGATVDNQRFSWQWQTPVSEKYQSLKGTDDRSVTTSNLGVYKLKVSSGTFSKTIPFKVSADPENDSLPQKHIVVSAEKPVYRVDEKLKVVGSVITSERGQQGLSIPDRVRISVQPAQFPFPHICGEPAYTEQGDDSVLHPLKRIWTAYCAFVYPDQSGDFESIFELPATVFNEGEYKIRADYSTLQTEATFNVVNDFSLGVEGDVTLLISTDKTSYHPGDLVTVTGKPSKLIYPEKFDVSVIKKAEGEVLCGAIVCGVYSGPVTSITPNPSGFFIYEFKLDESQSSVGIYEVAVDADFETKSVAFDVIPKPSVEKPEPVISTIIEKVNRLPDSSISILAAAKLSEDGNTMYPRVLSGSMLTPAASDQLEVNLMVSSESGTCVVGPNPDCLVQDSTRKPGTIYDVVEIDGTAFNVRYSGPDVRLERFDIVPKDQAEFIPDSNWNVEILKDEQPSRFYYKINYKITQ